jgi:hypothetical protein
MAAHLVFSEQVFIARTYGRALVGKKGPDPWIRIWKDTISQVIRIFPVKHENDFSGACSTVCFPSVHPGPGYFFTAVGACVAKKYV